MNASVWDDPDLKTGGEFISFENIGDTASGVINAIRTHRFDDGKVVPQILLTTDDGEERTLTAGQVRLKAELAEKRPEAGDHLKVTLSDIEKRSGGKTLKHFTVEVNHGGAPAVATTPASAPAAQVTSVDTEAAAAALANLTPEQKAALGIPA
jgi:hypothetical protein